MAGPPDVTEVVEGSDEYEAVLGLADRVLAQRRYMVAPMPHALESVVLGAFDGAHCVGFLRYLIQVIGAAEGRPPVMRQGLALTEGFVESLGVDPGSRRRGIGTALQRSAQERCRRRGCYQVRSRSPITSTENYALKLEAGYTLSPSEQNDSYYFMLRL